MHGSQLGINAFACVDGGVANEMGGVANSISRTRKEPLILA
jgi:hypothetical protein